MKHAPYPFSSIIMMLRSWEINYALHPTKGNKTDNSKGKGQKTHGDKSVEGCCVWLPCGNKP